MDVVMHALKVCKEKGESKVALEQVKLHKEAVEALFEGIADLHVDSLEVTGCNIDSDGLKAFEKELTENRCLTTLNLSGNNIGSEGAKWIGEGLRENGCLVTIGL